jgi:ribosomal protein L12E/L44/L45/RPP1/RPP2
LKKDLDEAKAGAAKPAEAVAPAPAAKKGKKK